MAAKKKRARDAGTGEFIPLSQATANPDGTVIETVKAPPPMQRAFVDEHGLLLGFDGGNGTGNGPEVPLPCDLAPNRYRWDAARATFVPLGRIQGMPGPGGARIVPPVDATVALTRGLMALFAATGVPVPPYTQRYFDWFMRESVDGKEK